ncbi:riboflavin biosynthesis protein RibF [Enterococcus timonensis]|uniref:riboflavin biosynthesis protein RibF n=1 Tax=Enterococcus timonensis TaxID=1852364 RepID=UPI0008D9C52B|nr:riboflavin biosynthesis protein RibF [Enterococcus timonensis]
MKIIHLHHPYQKSEIPDGPVVLVLGFFDGLHRGHQKVIDAGRTEAKEKNVPLALMTFNQHPSIVFQKLNREITQYLTNLPEKERLLADFGIDILYVVEFTSAFAALPPQQFVDDYLVGLHAQSVVTGFDYTYGPKNIADVDHLPDYSQGRFKMITVPSLDEEGKKVSSTRIRADLAQGAMDEVTELLGRPYQVRGIVVHGDARGRLLGYPTANLEIEKDVRLPMEGVYVTKIFVNDQWYEAMTSVGHNDTFGEGRKLTVEANILNFAGDIYGEQVLLEFYHLIRKQVKFNSADELIEQLAADAVVTQKYFG